MFINIILLIYPNINTSIYYYYALYNASRKHQLVITISACLICAYYVRLNNSCNNYYIYGRIFIRYSRGYTFAGFFFFIAYYFFIFFDSTDVKIRRQQTRKLLSLRVNLFLGKRYMDACKVVICIHLCNFNFFGIWSKGGAICEGSITGMTWACAFIKYIGIIEQKENARRFSTKTLPWYIFYSW